MPTTLARVLFAPPTESQRFLPEGPRITTVGGRDALVWVNIQTTPAATAGELHVRFWDTGEHRAVPLADRPGFWFPTSDPDRVLVGMGKRVGLVQLATGAFEPLAEIPDAEPRTIVNDGEIVPGGRAVVFGTKDTKFAGPIAHLYLLTLADRKVSVLADGQLCSNGKVFAGGFLYDIDTPQKVVTRYRLDVENRTATNDGVAVDLRQHPAFPDGMCDAGDGTAVVAFFDPSAAAHGRAGRYRLDTGELLEEWHTPGSPRVTCPLLVKRPDGVKLVLTTADEGMPPEVKATSPNAGCLFVADTTLTGVPAAEVVRLG